MLLILAWIVLSFVSLFILFGVIWLLSDAWEECLGMAAVFAVVASLVWAGHYLEDYYAQKRDAQQIAEQPVSPH